ncbi:hypothetical protein GGS23DRAFT_554250 [Durotheca rogersii]|uniref:uncharacterized protein n=1 Tax=Durotheca rogersii TaxID=419775 RepID=UPI0022205FFE|nr:uncharacterized protein GGS23DRAFT_554250 [Durotheca rogersii]KAI5865824.1 hypothetical protein GGS23DRAFT_554250 [Durotheca rogersii]
MLLSLPHSFPRLVRSARAHRTGIIPSRSLPYSARDRRAISTRAESYPIQMCRVPRSAALHSGPLARRRTPPTRSPIMPPQAHFSSAPEAKKKPQEPRPSSSVILLSPENQILLLHRVQTSSAFPSAHVFPGGNLSDFHDGEVPEPGKAERHQDSEPYRLAAIRETFEECGILLAREAGGGEALLNIASAKRDQARKSIYDNSVRFVQWLQEVGGTADTANLLPFTRWVTPAALPRRFTTQMYIYMLPLSTSDDPVVAAARSEAIVPTPDGGVEINAARFDAASTWLERQRRGEITLFPPQHYLLHVLSRFLTGPPPDAPGPSELAAHYGSQREKLKSFLATVPTATDPEAAAHHTSQIPWADKVLCPISLGVRRSDQRVILGLDKPGPELEPTGRGGDWENIVLARFSKGHVKEVEVKGRKEMHAEEREYAKRSKKSRL